MPEIQFCLTTACAERAAWKGLCPKCYRSAKRAVDANYTTWERLAELGLAILPGGPICQATDLFLEELRKREEENAPQ